MSFDIAGAKKAGYTQKEIDVFLDSRPELKPEKFDFKKAIKEGNPTKQEREEKAKLDFDTEGALKAGYTPDEINHFLKKQSATKGASLFGAGVKGLVKGLHDIEDLTDILGWFGKSTTKEFRNKDEEFLEKALPSKDQTAEQFLGRTARLFPSTALLGGAAVPSALATVGGGVGGQIAQESGAGPIGQAIGELAGSFAPGLIKGAVKKGSALFNAPKETLTSGLTKPVAIEAPFPKAATISGSRQKKVLDGLNKEASELTKQAIHKELPIAKEIEGGFDFESKFQKDFSQLRKIAKDHNASIEIEPIESLFAKKVEQYRNIPSLHKEAAKIKKEIILFMRNPQEGLYELLKIFRSNGRKRSEIFQTAHFTGKQKEYADFLGDYNRAITESISKTLPEDSAWLKSFKSANAEYSNYSKANETTKILKPILEGKLTTSSIIKLADDARLHSKLQLSLGQKGAKEVVQVAKDLKKATQAIKNIPIKELKSWEAFLPIGILIPGVHIPGGIVSVKKSYDFARRGYGWYLSSSKRAKAYSDALKAISEGNKAAYAKAAKVLKDSFQEED